MAGERSYGKGSVQSLFRLAPDQKTAVKLTTQTWWRPSGKNMDRLRPRRSTRTSGASPPTRGWTVSISDNETAATGIEVEKLEFVAGQAPTWWPGQEPAAPQVPKQEGKPMWDEASRSRTGN